MAHIMGYELVNPLYVFEGKQFTHDSVGISFRILCKLLLAWVEWLPRQQRRLHRCPPLVKTTYALGSVWKDRGLCAELSGKVTGFQFERNFTEWYVQGLMILCHTMWTARVLIKPVGPLTTVTQCLCVWRLGCAHSQSMPAPHWLGSTERITDSNNCLS